MGDDHDNYDPHSERLRRQFGEYYLSGDDLSPEDRRQNSRLRELEEAVTVLRTDISTLWRTLSRLETAIVGHNGKGGIQGTMQDNYDTTNGRLDKLEVKVDGLAMAMTDIVRELSALTSTFKTLSKIVSGVSVLAGTVWVVMQILEELSRQGGIG